MKADHKKKKAMNLNLVALFSLGAFFSFLSYLVTTFENKLFKRLGKSRASLWIISRAIF